MNRFLLAFCLLFACCVCQAQWANTNNSFTDNSHLPVSIANNDQTSPITIASPTDSSVIVAWMDSRNGNKDIYAQKFDKNGNPVWAANGIAIASGTENQYYYTTGSSNYEPQFYSFMATDSAGGFFIAWEDANTAAGNNKNKVCVQHVKADGSLVFGAAGYTVAAPLAGDNFYYTKPQLVADGTGGFFVSYLMIGNGYNKLLTYCYKDSNGVLQSFGGGQMNESLRETYFSTQCASIATLAEADLGTVADYQLFSNQQNGCGVIFRHATSLYGKEYIGTNQLIRVKKNCTVTRNPANTTTQYNNAIRYYNNYKKDSVVKLYSPETLIRTYTCTAPGNSTIYTVQSFQVTRYGFETLDNNGGSSSYLSNALSYAKATSLPAYGNIVPTVFTWYKKEEATNEVLLKHVDIAYEMYDSVPYQLASDTNLIPVIVRPSNLLKINGTIQTLLASTTNGNIYNYHIAGADKNIFVTAKIRPFATLATVNSIYLQKMRIYNVTTDSIEFRLETPNNLGREVGKDVNGGSQATSISLSYPGIAINSNGDAMYYVSEYYRYIRVSPVGDSCKLLWGANGKPIGTGYIGTSPYQPQYPTAVFMPNNQRAAICWQENYRATYNGTGENIMLRNIDSLPSNVLPARRPVSLLTTAPTTATFTLLPQNLLGTSNSYTSFEAINGTGTEQHSLVAEILDNTNLGAVNINVYQHAGAVRQTGGTFYLNRNYSITPATQPTNPVTVRLFFTAEEFNALKTADPLITTVASLAVTKLNGSTAPAAFPGGAAQLIVPEDWQAVTGGYYIQFKVSSFSSFWIHRNTNAALPATLGNINIACINNQPTIQFSTLSETNFSHFEVELYTNNNWQKQFSITAKNASNGYSYQQVLNTIGLYRLKMIDKDGNYVYSKTADVNCKKQNINLSVYPNPTTNQIIISVVQVGGSIKLYNAQGIMLLQQTVYQQNNNVSLAKYAAGIYTIVYQDKDGNSSKQTIIKQ